MSKDYAELLTPEVRTLFRAAVVDLETNGWYQGSYYPVDWGREVDGTQIPPQNCPACALGAMVRAYGKDFDAFCKDPVAEAAEIALIRRIGGMPVGPWNDAYGRTAEEVIGVLKELADG